VRSRQILGLNSLKSRPSLSEQYVMFQESVFFLHWKTIFEHQILKSSRTVEMSIFKKHERPVDSMIWSYRRRTLILSPTCCLWIVVPCSVLKTKLICFNLKKEYTVCIRMKTFEIVRDRPFAHKSKCANFRYKLKIRYQRLPAPNCINNFY